mmetsp:Transcript_12295/g.22322  ORF Transcript_12295/g.22322 Transcript_12295/m.22322 type:complete len:104 (-) Transcript_12295:416-727(-)
MQQLLHSTAHVERSAMSSGANSWAPCGSLAWTFFDQPVRDNAWSWLAAHGNTIAHMVQHGAQPGPVANVPEGFGTCLHACVRLAIALPIMEGHCPGTQTLRLM